MDKLDITVEIEVYRMEIIDYHKWYVISFIVMILFPLPGIIWFIKRLRKKKELDKKKLEIQQMLRDISDKIPLDEYLEMRRRFNSTRQY